MRKNKKLIMNRPHFKYFISGANNPHDDNVSILRKKIALSKLAKAIWNSNSKQFITKTLGAEINLLIQIIEDPFIK